MTALINGGYTFTINGAYSFNAKDIKYNWESLATEDSGRTLDGVMHIYGVLNNIHKVEITLPPCDAYTINRIINLVQGRTYQLSWYDPASGQRTMTCYTSNAHSSIYSGVVHNGIWQDFTFNAIEVAGDIY